MDAFQSPTDHYPIIPLSHCYPMTIPWSSQYRMNTTTVYSAGFLRLQHPCDRTAQRPENWILATQMGYPRCWVMKCHFFKAFGLKKHVYDTWPNNLGISHKAWLFSWETLASWFPRYPVWMVLQCFIWFTSLAVAKPNQLFNIFNDVHGCSCRRYYGSPFVDSVSSLIFRWCFHHDGPVYRWFAY